MQRRRIMRPRLIAILTVLLCVTIVATPALAQRASDRPDQYKLFR